MLNIIRYNITNPFGHQDNPIRALTEIITDVKMLDNILSCFNPSFDTDQSFPIFGINQDY